MTEQINTFELSKEWHEYMAENINVKPIHSCLYFAIVNKWNVLFWKKQFGLPTENMMQTINILSYKTYIKTLNELEEFGFIKIVSRSKNQNTSNIVEVVNNTKATTKASTKANTKAMLKATTQSDDQSEHQSDDQSVASIIKLLTNNKEQITSKHLKELNDFINSFNSVSNNDIEEIYNSYPSKCLVNKCSTGKSLKDKDKIKTLLKTKSKDDLIKIIDNYKIECVKSNRYMKNFSTFLNNLPDIEIVPEQSKEIYIWDSKLDGRKQGTKEKFDFELKVIGKENIKFVGYGD